MSKYRTLQENHRIHPHQYRAVTSSLAPDSLCMDPVCPEMLLKESHKTLTSFQSPVCPFIFRFLERAICVERLDSSSIPH